MNTGMCRLAGELCQGMRPHPICTPTYIAEVMLPAVKEVLDAIAVIGTHGQIAGTLKQRYGGVATGVEFGIALRAPADRGR